MVFRSLSQKFGRKSAELIFLGAPEAEAEALPSSKMPLSAVYEDHHNLLASLENEKFIICGRKGSGKSAFAEYVSLIAKNEANIFCKFIRQGEANLEKVVQLGKEAGHGVERENLYVWLILTNILKLFTDNQAVQNNREYQLLSQFLQRNSGYIDIREAEIKELIRKGGFEVSIEYFKRYFSSKHNKSIEIRQEKAPFYKLIPHLKEVVLKVLKSDAERENGNSYLLFFDDLDIAFNAEDKGSIDSIVSLLRVSKEVNNEFFAKNNLESKVVILLRDDIAKSVSAHHSDTAKLFSSYSVHINWYQDEYHKSSPETDLHIRKFINARVSYAFRSQFLSVDSQDPWHGLVEDPFASTGQSEGYGKTSFKYILDHTLFRPRDLILFFGPLQKHAYQLPLSKHDVNQLIGRYCDELVSELRNELSCFYSSDQIVTILSVLGQMTSACKSSSLHCMPYEDAAKIISETCNNIDSSVLLEDLFERSMIGNMGANGFVFFKHREPSSDTYVFNVGNRIVLHNAIKVYSSNRGYA